MTLSRATPVAVAVVLSLALLAQSACTYNKTIPFRAEPGDVGKVVAFITMDSVTILIERAEVRSDTLFYFTGTVSGSCPVEDIESVTVKSIAPLKTGFAVAGVLLLAGAVYFAVVDKPSGGTMGAIGGGP